MQKPIVTFFCLLMFSHPLFAADSRIDKAGFLPGFISGYSVSACEKKHAFRVCFRHVRKDQCEKFVKTIGKSCANKLAKLYPSRINYKQSIGLGDKVALCVRMAFVRAFGRDKVKTRSCIEKTLSN